jgi:hypothetical protein
VRNLAAPVLGLAVASAAIWPAAAQTPDPPCAPGVAPSATIRADDGDGPLTATHAIRLELESGDGSIDDFTVALPPGAEALHGNATPTFRVDTPGPVPITATWSHFILGDASTCSASAATTLDVEAAKPVRYIAPAPRGIMNSLRWRVRFGKDADLRPVQVRLRGVRRARLPGASARVQTVTFSLSGYDKGLSYDGNPQRVLRSAGWHFDATWFRRGEFGIQMEDSPNGRSFGFELELTQAGRRLGRTRAVGRCNSLFCRYHPVR